MNILFSLQADVCTSTYSIYVLPIYTYILEAQAYIETRKRSLLTIIADGHRTVELRKRTYRFANKESTIRKRYERQSPSIIAPLE